MNHRLSILQQSYHDYLLKQSAADFIQRIARRYTVGTLERLAVAPQRETRRAAVLALGFVAEYSSNAVLGRALRDEDRGVRIAAENGIVCLWCRDGDDAQRQQLGEIIRRLDIKQFDEALWRANQLIELAPQFAEAFNQRAIALYSLGEFEDSIADCARVLELNPFHFAAASGMGHCRLQLGHTSRAVACFGLALRINPNLEGVRANIARLKK